MKRYHLMVLCGLLAACGPEFSQTVEGTDTVSVTGDSLTAVSSFGSNPGALKMYKYVPANMPANAAVVVAMHGCTQTAADFDKVGWSTVAEQNKFYVIFPEQTTNNNPLRCFNWGGEFGDPANIQRGQGENESIRQMVEKMKADHSIDPKKVFVTGFSGGGAQTTLMLAVWPDVFAAGASVAGVPYNCTTTFSEVSSCLKPGKSLTPKEWGDKVRAATNYTGPWPRITIWQGTADSVVDYTNTTQIMNQWTNVQGIDTTADFTDTTSIAGATRKEYRDANGKALVETVGVTGMDHGMSVDPAHGCGTAGSYILDKGICTTLQIARYFGIAGSTGGGGGSTGGGGGSTGGGGGSTGGGGGSTGGGGGSHTGGGGGAIGGGGGSTGGGGGSHTGGGGGSTGGGAGGGGATGGGAGGGGGTSCQQVTDTTYNLVVAGKAVRCGTFNFYACAGGTQLGLWNVFTTATVHSNDGGATWVAGACK